MHTLAMYPALCWCWTGPGACNAALIHSPISLQLFLISSCHAQTDLLTRHVWVPERKTQIFWKERILGKKSVLQSMPGTICSWRPVVLSQPPLYSEKDTCQHLQRDVPLDSSLCQTFLSWSTDTNCLLNSGSQRLPESEQEHSGEVPAKDQQRISSCAEILSGCHLPNSSCPTITVHSHCSACAFAPVGEVAGNEAKVKFYSF